MANKTPFPMGGAVTTERYVKEKRDTVLRYVKALAQALHYLKTNREGSCWRLSPATRVSIIARCMGAAFDAARRLYSDILVPRPKDSDLVARGTCPAQSEVARFRHEKPRRTRRPTRELLEKAVF